MRITTQSWLLELFFFLKHFSSRVAYHVSASCHCSLLLASQVPRTLPFVFGDAGLQSPKTSGPELSHNLGKPTQVRPSGALLAGEDCSDLIVGLPTGPGLR